MELNSFHGLCCPTEGKGHSSYMRRGQHEGGTVHTSWNMKSSVWGCGRLVYTLREVQNHASEWGFTYLHQEEGNPVGAEGPGQFHILHFGLDLRHLATVLVVLHVY